LLEECAAVLSCCSGGSSGSGGSGGSKQRQQQQQAASSKRRRQRFACTREEGARGSNQNRYSVLFVFYKELEPLKLGCTGVFKTQKR